MWSRPDGMTGRLLRGGLACLPAFLTGQAAALSPAYLVAGMPRGQIVLDTAGPRCLLIDAWLAQTRAQQAQGLMFVTALPEFEGMYFGHDAPVELAMWMKNTILPLDIIFVREDGTIGHIARDATPYSTVTISSGGPVIGVLELNAGFTRRWQVEPGTRLQLQ
ncbi:MAG: DUF192 domain-containing protein [Gammaproteobacteria bacterium PRO9]|nr:DUF192 domain-containing protein [Gammaproteobacteria bacterium PRO9]